jgi:hypothetical protein
MGFEQGTKDAQPFYRSMEDLYLTLSQWVYRLAVGRLGGWALRRRWVGRTSSNGSLFVLFARLLVSRYVGWPSFPHFFPRRVYLDTAWAPSGTRPQPACMSHPCHPA